MKQSGSRSLDVYSWGTLLLFCLIALLPVGCAFLPPVWGGWKAIGSWLGAFRPVLLDARQWSLMANSVAIAAGTTVAATGLGVMAGIALEYCKIPTRRLLAYAMAASFLVPPYIFAVAWIDLLGKNGVVATVIGKLTGMKVELFDVYSVAGVIFVLALSYYPIVALVTVLAIRSFDRRLEEAALFSGTRIRALFRVTLPLLSPSILSGSLFVFLLSLVGFSVPSLLTVNVYTVEIYSRFSSFHDFQEGSALALPLLFMGGAVILMWAVVLRPGKAWLTGARKQRCAVPVRGWPVGVAFTLCWALVLVSSVLPLLVLLGRSLPVESFIQAFQTAKEEMLTSLLVAGISATTLSVLGFSMAYFSRSGFRGLYGLSFLPFLVSGPVLGIGLIRLWNHPGPTAFVYDSLLVMIHACAARYLVFAHHGSAAAFANLDPGMEQAASVHGIGWFRQVTGIVIPVLSPALIGIWGFTFLLCLAELDAVILVYPPGFTTLPVRLFSLMHYGPSQTVAALSLITVIMVLSAAAVIAYLYGRTRRLIHARD